MKKYYILIVEDNVLLYDNLAEKLRNENFEVSDFTPSVDEAISSIEKKQPDIALLDIKLEGEKTGFDLAEIISNKYHFPFIYVTGIEKGYYKKAFQSQNHDIIMKSTSFDFFNNILRSIYKSLELNKNNK